MARISAAWLLAATPGASVLLSVTVPASAATAGSPLATKLSESIAAYDAQDYPRARRHFTTLADQGSAVAETMLGVIYARGQGVAADPATAAAYWLRAASRGYAPAQLAFARALANGAGVGRSPGAAWVWASLAARGGDVAVAHEASGLAARLRRGFKTEQAAALAKRLAGWRPWMAR